MAQNTVTSLNLRNLIDSESKKMMEAQILFANSRVIIIITAEGKAHLGAVIGSMEYRDSDEYMKDLVKDWDNQLTILSTIAEIQL